MAVSEPDRHELYLALEEKIGKKPTETFMNLVTTVPWTEVATKGDLKDLRAEMQKALRGQLMAFIVVSAAFNGVALAVLKLG